jgi:hypothetical protein
MMMDDGEGFENVAGVDEDSVDSFRTNESSRGSAKDGTLYYEQFMSAHMCGAKFHAYGNVEKTFICFNSSPCRRQLHKAADHPGIDAYYYAQQKSTRGFVDGVLGTEITEAEYQELVEAEQAEDEEALVDYGLQATEKQLHPTLLIPTGTPNWAQQLEGTIYEPGTLRRPDAPSKQRTPAKSGRPGSVQFSSPTILPPAETRSSRVGKASPSQQAPSDNAKIEELVRQVELLSSRMVDKAQAKVKPNPKAPPSPKEQQIFELQRQLAALEEKLSHAAALEGKLHLKGN